MERVQNCYITLPQTNLLLQFRIVYGQCKFLCERCKARQERHRIQFGKYKMKFLHIAQGVDIGYFVYYIYWHVFAAALKFKIYITLKIEVSVILLNMG